MPDRMLAKQWGRQCPLLDYDTSSNCVFVGQWYKTSVVWPRKYIMLSTILYL